MKSRMMKMLVVAFGLACFGLMGCDLKDADGSSYPTVKIGQQIWMAKNMNVNVPGSMCYDNDPANCEKYGRLYTLEAAMNACPSGWHLPSKVELYSLLLTVGVSREERSLNLRSGSWKNGVDKYGFSALPAGLYDGNRKEFGNLGEFAYFWSSTGEDYGRSASLLHVDGGLYGDGSAFVSNYHIEANGFSVRCLQD